MTPTPTSGAADLPEALRSIQRFEVVDCIDDKHVPAVIPNPHGPWVRYADHIAALAAGQATAAQAVVPAEWPTNEMIDAGRKAAASQGRLLGSGQSLWHVFRAMLAAAPAQPAAQQPHRSGCTAGTDEECVQRGCGTNCPAVSPRQGVAYAALLMERAMSDTTTPKGQALTPVAEPAYSAACNLATALFKKHFAHLPDFASGQAAWSLCDSTAGVISQIDNMVAGLVQPPTASPQAADTGAAAPLLDYAMQIAHERELRVTGNAHDEDGAKLRFEAAIKQGATQ